MKAFFLPCGSRSGQVSDGEIRNGTRKCPQRNTILQTTLCILGILVAPICMPASAFFYQNYPTTSRLATPFERSSLSYTKFHHMLSRISLTAQLSEESRAKEKRNLGLTTRSKLRLKTVKPKISFRSESFDGNNLTPYTNQKQLVFMAQAIEKYTKTHDGSIFRSQILTALFDLAKGKKTKLNEYKSRFTSNFQLCLVGFMKQGQPGM